MAKELTTARVAAGSTEEVDDLPVQGMTCANCAGRVQRALSAVPGVHAASVNFATKNATVHYDPARTDLATLARAVTEAGYEVPLPTRAPAADARGAATAAERAAALAAAEQRDERTLRRDFAVAVALTVPLMILGMSHGAIPGSDGELGRLVQLLLATPVMFGPGMRFVRLALSALRHRSADMNTLVSVGAGAAYAYSALAVVAPHSFGGQHGAPHVYFEAGAAIVTFVLLGKLLETRARRRLSDAVRGLGTLLPSTATRVLGARQEQVAPIDLAPDDLVLVRPGERVPGDGTVVEGRSAVDESMLTGESVPVDKAPGARLFGGTLNQSGALTMRVEHAYGDTAIARIIEAVEQAQGARAPIASLADRVSAYFVPIVIGIALVTFAVWLALDPSSAGLSVAIERFVAVLVIACPCALGLATPAAVAVGTGRGAELGVLIKGGAALEAASHIDTVLFDKTGTLTEGKPELTDVIALAATDEHTLLALAASVEASSEHPIARAIVQGAEARGSTREPITHFASSAGFGAEARAGGRTVRIGTRAWLAQAGVDVGPLAARAEALAAAGRTPTFVAIDGALSGLLAVADRPAADAPKTLAALARDGIEVAMITGDQRGTAEAIAATLGITRVFAEVTPVGKARVVTEEHARGRIVAMVGDGINDAPALAAAQLGIAVGSGTDVALAAADITLLRGGIGSLPIALALARATMRTIRQNLFWAFVYNLLGLPLAAGVLYPFTGWLLSPVFASAAMSLSSVSVLANSLRLRRYRP